LLTDLAHHLILPRLLRFKAPDLFLALTNLHGEPGKHTLSLDLQVPLNVKLALEEGGLLLGICMQKDSSLSHLEEKEQVGVGREKALTGSTPLGAQHLSCHLFGEEHGIGALLASHVALRMELLCGRKQLILLPL
jgi:hypothetical protein